jgi:hypothetical protein
MVDLKVAQGEGDSAAIAIPALVGTEVKNLSVHNSFQRCVDSDISAADRVLLQHGRRLGRRLVCRLRSRLARMTHPGVDVRAESARDPLYKAHKRPDHGNRDQYQDQSFNQGKQHIKLAAVFIGR